MVPFSFEAFIVFMLCYLSVLVGVFGLIFFPFPFPVTGSVIISGISAQVGGLSFDFRSLDFSLGSAHPPGVGLRVINLGPQYTHGLRASAGVKVAGFSQVLEQLVA